MLLPADSMEAPSDGLTDLERMQVLVWNIFKILQFALQAQANSIADKSLESSRRMVGMLMDVRTS